ncbi:MAG: hypothetical protein CMM52_14885 [Rhodospirillaceae bacterium]|nr:hypothetical protein [Rhodospirillaceae bacterium]|tara:strand:+ start:5415 stop:6125 length:711 start_codon:yes stop_codon:yes gene_type:complete
MPDQATENEIRERARKLQALHVKLLFCRATQENWLQNPNTILAEFNLPASARDKIADITTDQFRAESHGRRGLVERSLAKTFPETQKHLEISSAQASFEAFLCSEDFLNPKTGLPHISGVGQGYENNSKYFFWLKRTMRLASADCDVELRNKAHTEFATWLINEYKRPHDPYFDQFEGGLYWMQTPGAAKPVILLSDQFVVYTLNDPNTISQLPKIGLTDLDDVSPPDWPEEETLL